MSMLSIIPSTTPSPSARTTLTRTPLGRQSVTPVALQNHGPRAEAHLGALQGVLPHRRKETIDILVVDDDQTIRTLLARVLHHHGFRVLTAEDGLQVIDLCLKYKPRLIILDMMIPGADGKQIVHSLRRRLGSAAPDVALVTASWVEDKMLSKLRPVEYLQKPFSLDSILAVAKKYASDD